MGASNEEELDKWVSKMTVEGREADIKCPVLMTVGEYDSRSPVELVYDFITKSKLLKNYGYTKTLTIKPECLVLTKNVMINICVS